MFAKTKFIQIQYRLFDLSTKGENPMQKNLHDSGTRRGQKAANELSDVLVKLLPEANTRAAMTQNQKKKKRKISDLILITEY